MENNHIKSKTSSMPTKRHECELCSVTTGRKFDLKRHKMLKHGYKPETSHISSASNNHPWISFVCDTCSYSTDREYNIKRHVKTMHPKTTVKTLNNKENTNKDEYIKPMKAIRAQTYVENFIFNYKNVIKMFNF